MFGKELSCHNLAEFIIKCGDQHLYRSDLLLTLLKKYFYIYKHMFVYTHVSTHLGNVALILLEKKKPIPPTLKHIKSLAKKGKESERSYLQEVYSNTASR